MDSNLAARCLSPMSDLGADEPLKPSPSLSSTLSPNTQTSATTNSATTTTTTSKIVVEPSQIEFFYEKFKQCYPMYKNPRGQCLIINIYQINGMPPRRWSDRDTEALRQLFEQLLFHVTIYTDSTHDLTCQNLKNIIYDFSKLDEHEEAQCCVVCLMSHGEEGFLTTKEGNKVPLDDIFSMFNNVNCPNLAGKPKLFFIQSCRDDPITGPAEDLGIRLSYSTTPATTTTTTSTPSDSGLKSSRDETDSGTAQGADEQTDNNQAIVADSCLLEEQSSSPSNVDDHVYDDDDPTGNGNSLSQVFYHIPSLCDMIIGFPTQKGFIAYRKPEIGSWYMNAIVNVFSRYAHNTDLCAMLNMVNLLISNEVTNTGKKQMSEYTSKLTKPYFYFFPGLASETSIQPEKPKASSMPNNGELSNKACKLKPNESALVPASSSPSSFLYEPSSKRQCLFRANLSSLDQNDSSWHHQRSVLAASMLSSCRQSPSLRNWKHLGRELGLGESFIREFASLHKHETDDEKLNSLVQYLCEKKSKIIASSSSSSSSSLSTHRPMIQYNKF